MNNKLREWLPLIIILLIVLLSRIFIFSPVKVEGHSMDPTLHDGQRLISFKLSSPSRQDIITCKEPDNPDLYIVKRVIGLPGDKIKMEHDTLTINGKIYKEPYLNNYKKKFEQDKLFDTYSYNANYQNLAAASENFTSYFSVTVPKNKYFVLGDNRLISKDSRIFGFVDKSSIQGEVILRFWPLNKIQTY